MKKRKLNTDNTRLETTILPENIKEEIKKHVAELKEVLKDESEFCISLIKLIVNNATPQGIAHILMDHYKDQIKQSEKTHKGWPLKITRVYHIEDFLSHLVSGYDKLLFDVAKSCEFDDDIPKKLKDLAILSRIEIGAQFNPEVDYRMAGDDIGRDILEFCGIELSGETVEQDVDDL